MFQIEMLPETLSLPSFKTSARLAGGFLHLVHLCVCVSRIRKVPESATGWEEMYMEAEELPWFDWVCPIVLRLSSREFDHLCCPRSDVARPDLLDQRRSLEFHISLFSHTYLRSRPPADQSCQLSQCQVRRDRYQPTSSTLSFGSLMESLCDLLAIPIKHPSDYRKEYPQNVQSSTAGNLVSR